jgi:hypothetical protein
MRSTFEIQAEMNVIGEICFDSGPLEVRHVRPAAMRPQHNVQANYGNDADDDCPLK